LRDTTSALSGQLYQLRRAINALTDI